MNKLRTGGALFAASLLAASCGSDKHFDNRDGDIIAGEPAEVLQVWHSSRSTGKHGPAGYVLYLVTEDCPEGVAPTPGNEVSDACDLEKHKTDPATFRGHDNGDTLQWSGKDGISEVQEHRYGRKYRYSRVHDFALLVRQCVESESDATSAQVCVEDFVEVNFDTWYGAEVGDVLVFSGDKGDVVSD